MKTPFLRNKTVTYFLISFSSSFLFVIYFIFNQYSYSELSANNNINTFIDTLIKKADKLFDEYRYNDAIQLYDKVLEINSTDTYIDALNYKGIALSSLGRYDEAIQYFDKVLEVNPNDINALDSKNTALDKLGNIDRYDESINK